MQVGAKIRRRGGKLTQKPIDPEMPPPYPLRQRLVVPHPADYLWLWEGASGRSEELS